MKAHAKRWEEVAVTAHQSEPAVRPPCPVPDDRINKTSDAEAIQKIADESGAADHRARGNGRTGIGEGKLEYPDCQERDAGGFVGRRRALKEKPVIADEAVAMAEHECKADGIKQNAAEA